MDYLVISLSFFYILESKDQNKLRIISQQVIKHEQVLKYDFIVKHLVISHLILSRGVIV